MYDSTLSSSQKDLVLICRHNLLLHDIFLGETKGLAQRTKLCRDSIHVQNQTISWKWIWGVTIGIISCYGFVSWADPLVSPTSTSYKWMSCLRTSRRSFSELGDVKSHNPPPLEGHTSLCAHREADPASIPIVTSQIHLHDIVLFWSWIPTLPLGFCSSGWPLGTSQ